MLLDSFFFGQEIWPFGSVLVCTLRPTQDAHGGSEFARPCQAAAFPSFAMRCIFVFVVFCMSQNVSKFESNELHVSFRMFSDLGVQLRPSIAELYSWRYRDLGNLPNVLTDERRIWF